MKSLGFTLLEVLVALAVIALGLGAAVRATGQVVASAEQTKLRTLALWVAQDRLAGHRVRKSWLAPGVSGGAATQAGIEFAWREQVAASPDPAVRTIEIAVSAASQPDYRLARLATVLSAPP